MTAVRTEITCASALVWHQRLCKRCHRYAKCAEWWEILTEFRVQDTWT